MNESPEQKAAEPVDPAEVARRRKANLYRLRHSAAHIMAQAVLEVFPDAKLAIGPPIADGFYYDFDLPRALSDADLADLEKRMKRIVKGNHKFTSENMSRDDAKAFFADLGQDYKLELIDGIEDDELTIFRHDSFVDLCAGPHVQRTKKCKHFKLLSVAGAYWRGDSDRPMLQRIYGTVWPTKAELETFLEIREEAKRRDHRKLGKELELFNFHPYAPGAAFWHPKGVTVYDALVDYWRELQKKAGYVEIRNPLIYDSELYATSGHLEHYKDHMFTIESEGRLMCVKPMNCPDTMLYFGNRKRSYRELPMRVAETQVLHRNELSGALSGLTRVRQFTQDDAHIFCAMEQIQQEIVDLLNLVGEVYGLFGLDYRLYLSTRPDDYMGEIALWDQAEGALRSALEGAGAEYKVNEGDGAFYGPKIDIYVRDSLARMWQCATVQLDFQLPERFELEYVGTDNQMHRPVVIHRAIFGSLERFIGILIEHFAGAFPTWMAPTQVLFMPINTDCVPYCQDLADQWMALGIRVEVDDRTEKIGYKIRQAEMAKIPYMLVVGNKEVEADEVNLRTYKDGTRGSAAPAEVLAEIQEHIAERTLDLEVRSLNLEELVDLDDVDAEEKDY